MAISLKQAYAACLWLAERKLGIPVEEQRGEWDLTKDASLEVSRLDLITSLPSNYFDETSCYWGILSDDFEDEFAGLEFIDASNFLDGPIFKYEDQDNFHTYSPFRESPFFLPNGSEILSETESKGEMIATTPLELMEIDDLEYNSCKDENKSNQAKIAAHITLTSKLAAGQFTAKGRLNEIEDASYISETSWPRLIEDIPKSVWENKVIPNYAESALELGMMRFKDLLAKTAIEYSKQESRMEYLYACESWYDHITVENEQDFTNWIMPEVRKLFPIPKQATFKPQGKGYLVQFGTDKPTEIKSNNGVKILYKLLKDYSTTSFKEDSGYSLEMIEINEMEDDISNYEISSPTQRRKSSNIRKYIRKQHSLIFWKLVQLKTHQLDLVESSMVSKVQIDNQATSLDINKVKSSIFKRMSHINSINQDDVTCLDKDTLNALIELDPERFVSNRKKIKEMINVEMSEEEKSIDNTRNTINSAVKSIAKVAPHLAFYLGSAKSRSPRGIGYNNDLFYFICNDNIQWDFG